MTSTEAMPEKKNILIQLPEIYKQTPMFCGPTCLRMIFKFHGIEKTEEELAELTKASRTDGTSPDEIVRVAREFGFQAEYKTRSSIEELRLLIEQGVPPIVDWFSEENGHYSIVIGIDDEYVTMAEPLTGSTRTLTIKNFLIKWFELDAYPPQDPSNFTLRDIIIIKK